MTPRPSRQASGSARGRRASARREQQRSTAPSLVGREWEVEVGPVAHGGHCVARHEGQVVFVRHALPGERVVARVTEGREGDRFVRADAVSVLVASPDRVEAPCPYAGPGRCGGCDFQHASPEAQRRLKADVVREQLSRLAGLDRPDLQVEAVPGDREGLGWRTRVRLAVDPGTGVGGLRAHRSHEVVPVDRCLIADDALNEAPFFGRSWRGSEHVDGVAPSTGDVRIVTSRDRQPAPVTETVPMPGGDVAFTLDARGFWQVHPGAAGTLVDAVLSALEPRTGEHALDLYCGSGLFTAALARAVGEEGAVLGIESVGPAVTAAERNLEPWPQAAVWAGRVEYRLDDVIESTVPVDLVVLDPPRTGAGRDVVEALAELAPRAIAYVACDPAALARDLRTFAEHGYALADLRAFDLFPMTQHVECVALLRPQGQEL